LDEGRDKTRGASRTALGVAALRAIHQFVDGEPKLLDDPIAAKLLGPRAMEHLRARLADFETPGALALRSHVVLRSRYAEDRLCEAVERGLGQFVVLGAGFDTFAYRQPEWARPLRIFEVDQPASQDAKRSALASAGLTVPTNVTFVPCDFERQSILDALRGGGFNSTLPAFVSWLGVMVYLSEAAANGVFRLVAAFARPSEIVFTFSPRRPEGEGGSRLAAIADAVGEPWQNYVDPEELVTRLRGFGFSKVSLLTPEEAKARYFIGRSFGLPPPRHASIASAVV
jgi:methyltransferase (TIGR00027 family)